MRHRSRDLTPLPALVAGAALLLGAGCRGTEPDPALRPDSVLRAELGLSDADRVHRMSLRGGRAEVVEPNSVELAEGDWLEFVSADWRIHAVRFEVDSLEAPARAFLEGSDQVASPPLVELGQRFVVSFGGAPEGRYPFLVEGNGTTVRGVVVVGPRR